MKKTLITLFAVFGIYSLSFAQTKNTTEIGLDVGYNAARITNSASNMNTDYTSGLNAGFSAEYFFSNRWGIKGKLIYDQKGWGNGYIYDNNSGVEIDGVNFHVNYLTIPVMANWHFGRTRNWYLNFGPYVGVLLNASESTNSGYDVKSLINTTDFGLAAGIGVKFPVSDRLKLFIEADGQSGVTNVFKDSGGSSLQNERSSINFGMIFPLK